MKHPRNRGPDLRSARILAIAGLAVSFVCGCGSDGTESMAEPVDELSYELMPWATELPAEVLEAIQDYDLGQGVLRFDGAPAAVTARQPGDVLVGGKSSATPKGLLVAVVAVTQEGGDTVVETLPIPLPLAFKSLHASLSRQGVDLVAPQGVNRTATLAPSLSLQTYKTEKVVGGKRLFDVELYNLDQNLATKDDQFLVHAELQGQVGYSAKLDLGWLDDDSAIGHAHDCLKKVISDPLAVLSDCISLPDVKLSFDASLTGNGLLEVDGASAKTYASETIPLNEQPWELPDLYAGPVVLTPELDFTAKVEGDAATYFHARTEFGYDVSVHAAAGTKSGVTLPEPKFEKNVTQPIVEVSSTGHSKASFGPRLSLMAYGAFGFSADLHGFGMLDADQAQSPCWDYTLGVELTPGIRLRIPWKKFGLQMLADKMGWNWDYGYGLAEPMTLYEDHPFATLPPEQRACKKPPESALPLGDGPTNETYQTPTFTPWSYRFGGIEATQPFSTDPGQSHTPIEKTHSSSWVVSGASVGSVLHLANDGSVVWARALDLGRLPDEEDGSIFSEAASAFALASDAFEIFVASDRFTLLALDYDGTLKWAKRLRLPTGVPGPELRELVPVAMTRIDGGDFGILYSRQTYSHQGSEIVLLRVSKSGSVRFAKRFALPVGDRSLGSTLIPLGQDLVVAGHSFLPTETAAHFLRFDQQGALTYAKRLKACGEIRTRIESGTLRASGDLAFFGTYAMSPDRTFFATVSPDGEPRGIQAIWTGSGLEDVAGVAVAELPTSGFVSLAEYAYPNTSDALELSTHDSQGVRTNGRGYALEDEAGTGLANLRPAGLRLTTDGGILVTAHVVGDGAFDDHGLWISKVPARTFDAPFDPAFVQQAPSTFVEDPCTLDVSAATVEVEDLVLQDVDVAEIVSATPIAPVVWKRMQ